MPNENIQKFKSLDLNRKLKKKAYENNDEI